MTERSLRERLRAIRVFVADPPAFAADAAPPAPLPLLVDWLETAIDAGVLQPHAMVLATADGRGVPAARTLLLKDVDERGLWFASLADSPKGRDLEANPEAAVVLYWREQGRQVRVTGAVRPGPATVSTADFLARHPVARAGAIAGRQSEPLPDDAVQHIEAAARLVAEHPDTVAESWTAWVLEPRSVEFWQATPDRDQLRLRYDLLDGVWSHTRLWP